MKNRIGQKVVKNFSRIDSYIFTGSVTNGKFQLNLIPYYRNAWAPIIQGTINEVGDKVHLSVTFRSKWFILVFTVLFMLAAASELLFEILSANNVGEIGWFPLILLIFSYILFWIFFNLDVDKAIDALIEISKGEIE